MQARLEVDAKEIIGNTRAALGAVAPAAPRAGRGRLPHAGWNRLLRRQLGLTRAEVTAVATFYSMYRRTPTGEYLVGVCTNTLCAVMGGDAILEVLEDHLGIGTARPPLTAKVTLEHVECNAACDSRSGHDGQLGVLRQPDPLVGEGYSSTDCAPGAACSLTRRCFAVHLRRDRAHPCGLP